MTELLTLEELLISWESLDDFILHGPDERFTAAFQDDSALTLLGETLSPVLSKKDPSLWEPATKAWLIFLYSMAFRVYSDLDKNKRIALLKRVVQLHKERAALTNSFLRDEIKLFIMSIDRHQEPLLAELDKVTGAYLLLKAHELESSVPVVDFMLNALENSLKSSGVIDNG